MLKSIVLTGLLMASAPSVVLAGAQSSDMNSGLRSYSVLRSVGDFIGIKAAQLFHSTEDFQITSNLAIMKKLNMASEYAKVSKAYAQSINITKKSLKEDMQSELVDSSDDMVEAQVRILSQRAVSIQSNLENLEYDKGVAKDAAQASIDSAASIDGVSAKLIEEAREELASIEARNAKRIAKVNEDKSDTEGRKVSKQVRLQNKLEAAAEMLVNASETLKGKIVTMKNYNGFLQDEYGRTEANAKKNNISQEVTAMELKNKIRDDQKERQEDYSDAVRSSEKAVAKLTKALIKTGKRDVRSINRLAAQVKQLDAEITELSAIGTVRIAKAKAALKSIEAVSDTPEAKSIQIQSNVSHVSELNDKISRAQAELAEINQTLNSIK